MHNVEEIYNKCRESFLAERAKQELQVKNFAEKFVQIDSSVFEGKIEIPEEISLRAMIPEMYVDRPNQAIYEEQYNKAQEFFNGVTEIIANINKEANECLSRYQVLASAGQ